MPARLTLRLSVPTTMSSPVAPPAESAPLLLPPETNPSTTLSSDAASPDLGTPATTTTPHHYGASDNDECRLKRLLELRAVAQFFRRRFWWFCVLGVLAMVALQLSFLPRTSLNRDFRRWHNLHLTRADVKRIFLVQLKMGRPDVDGCTIEQRAGYWLGNFSDINAQHHASLAASDARPLAAAVECHMRLLGYATRAHTYALAPQLRSPVLLALLLHDSRLGRKLYTAPLDEPALSTPAYFAFGKNGSLAAPVVHANAGSPADFALLVKHSIPLQGRIAIFAHPLHDPYLLADKVALAEHHGCSAVVVYGDSDVDAAILRNYKPWPVPDRAFRVPISYRAVQPILLAMGPPAEPFALWKHAPVCLDNSLELRLTSTFAPDHLNATNVISRLDGVLNDGEVVIGAARDSLTSTNPLSGHAVMLEVMRRFQHLRMLGWTPLRTIRFVSWDASRSGALGSLANVDDTDVFKTNMPILAYINLDEDVVTGSHFSVDADPLFNHLIRRTARFVPFPKNSPYYKRLLKDEEEENVFELAVPSEDSDNPDEEDGDDDNDDDDDNETTLYRYWYNQDRVTINNKLGSVFAGKDSGTFQFLMDAPTINVKFSQSPKHNDSIFVPESAMYSKKWVENEVDKTYELHGLLVRFLGLLILSVEEHEVVDSRTSAFFKAVQSFFDELKRANKKQLAAWADEPAETQLVAKSTLFADLKERTKNDLDEPRTAANFSEIVAQTDVMMGMLVNQSHVFDAYNQEVEDLWTTDYPWYKLLRKVHIYAKFKVLNYKLLRLEKTLSARSEEDAEGVSGYHHFMYEASQGVRTTEGKQQRGAFGVLYEAMERGDMEAVVKELVSKYERLSAAYKRIA